jgi:hypothetical protein
MTAAEGYRIPYVIAVTALKQVGVAIVSRSFINF